ncbi:MAG: ABC transporter substrate-binding protein [Tannerellaceae bacterium]|jgi:iron complex transport system substrate-binding protein|nr:ABC transporter substrate-binding protein [Tannerellaceae bacterium]
MIAVLLLASTACVRQYKQQHSIVIEDMLGRQVSIPDTIERVVCIRAGTLRLLVYMHGADRIVGHEEGDKLNQRRPYLVAHPELTETPVIGPLMSGDAELILATHPDLIYTAYTTVAEADALQKKTGIPVIALECPELGIMASRDTLYASLRLIGRTLHKEERADSLINYMEDMICDLDRRTDGISTCPSVYVGCIAYGAMKDITSTQPYYPPFTFIHADNVAASIDKRLISHVNGTTIDREQLLVWNPDVLFFDESGLSLINDIKAGEVLFNQLKAIRNDRMFTLLPYNNYTINYELAFINCWYAGKILYPEAFADISVEKKGNEILQIFLGKPVFDEVTTANSFRQITKDELR